MGFIIEHDLFVLVLHSNVYMSCIRILKWTFGAFDDRPWTRRPLWQIYCFSSFSFLCTARQEAKVGKRISAWLMVICGGFVGFCILCKSGTLLKMLITVDCEAISRMVVVIYARQGGSSYLRARNSNKSMRWLRCNDMSNALRTPTSITAKITTAACTVMLSNLYVPESCLSTRYK